MENIERPQEVSKAQKQIMTEKNQQKYDSDQFNNIYNYLDKLNGEASGSVKQVSVSQTQASGTEIGKITVDGEETTLYAPQQTAVDIQMVEHYFNQKVGSAGTTKTVSQNISKSNYKPIGIVGTRDLTAGYSVQNDTLYLSASNDGSGTITMKAKNDANGADEYAHLYIKVLWIKS